MLGLILQPAMIGTVYIVQCKMVLCCIVRFKRVGMHVVKVEKVATHFYDALMCETIM